MDTPPWDDRLKPDAKICNCANCNTILVPCFSDFPYMGKMTRELWLAHAAIAGRIEGRPYCRACLARNRK